LSVSGLPADRYVFLGFLPRKGRERKELLTRVGSNPWTSVIFESAKRVVVLLRELATQCGPDRPAVVVRELTKVHEEVKSGTINELACYYEENTPRGEVTLLVAGSRPVADPVDPDAVRERAREWLSEGTSRRDTASRVADEFGMTRREAYRLVTDL
jgi:16S rRNA (cytidine1402-2'-O)-methyltransferase